MPAENPVEGHKEALSEANPQPPQKRSGIIREILDFLGTYRFFQKVFLLFFTLVVFGFFYYKTRHSREAISYFGVMLMVTMAYIEMLIIRDHLWVLEGSLPEARRWRNHFFSGPTLRQQKIRKALAVLFALVIFAYVYYKSLSVNLFSFIGIILMVTMLYFEVLTLRDEVRVLSDSLRAREVEEKVKHDLLNAPGTASPQPETEGRDGLGLQDDD